MTETSEQRAERIFKEDELIQKNRRIAEAEQRATTRLAFVNSSTLFTRTDISSRSNLGKFLRYVKGRSHVTGEDDEYNLLKLIRVEGSELNKKTNPEVKAQIEEMQKVFEVFEYGY